MSAVEDATRVRHGHRAARRGGLLAVVWLGVPAVWLLATGLVGRNLQPETAPLGTLILYALVFVGLPPTVIGLSRALLRRERRHQAAVVIRVRRPVLRQMRPPPVFEAERVPGARLRGRRRAVALSVLGVMFAIGLAVWTVVPVGWLWVGSQLEATGSSGMAPYLLVVAGIPATMLFCVRAVYRLGAVYEDITRRPPAARAPAAWLKSLGAERQRRPWSAADVAMTVSVIVALAWMAVWFMVFADPHAMMESYMD